MTHESRSHSIASLGLGLAGIGVYTVLALTLGGGFAIPVGILGALALGAAMALQGPLGKAIARKMDGTPLAEDGAADQLRAELDEMRDRVAELEERVDFSERLLAQQSRVPER